VNADLDMKAQSDKPPSNKQQERPSKEMRINAAAGAANTPRGSGTNHREMRH
jgi:hypothetical protein